MAKIIITVNKKTKEVVHAIAECDIQSTIDDACVDINKIITKQYKAIVVESNDSRLKKIQRTILIFDENGEEGNHGDNTGS